MVWVDRRRIYAALDLGTTNCRLLIARRGSGGGLRVVDSFSRVVRLGAGLQHDGSLSAAAMERTLTALSVCAGKLAHRGVTDARFVATEACRRASNCSGFVERVRTETGIGLEIISFQEEARLVLAGCATLLDAKIPNALVFDIGGGSTEVSWVRVRPGGRGLPRTEIRGVISIPLGVVSLTERYRDHPQNGDGFGSMVAEIGRYLAPFEDEWNIAAEIADGQVQMVGSSGTVTTLAAIELGLPRYDRAKVDGLRLRRDAIDRTIRTIVDADHSGRSLQPCIGPGRADLMLAGCAILSAIMELWPVDLVRVGDRGVREGILSGLVEGSAGRRHHPAPRPVVADQHAG